MSTVRYLMVDPPSGWKYGFPKVWDQDTHPCLDTWLLENGYPPEDLELCKYTRMWVPRQSEVSEYKEKEGA